MTPADLVSQIVGSIAVFAGTNVDDIVLLTVLFLASRASGTPKPSAIWLGQYLGIAVLVGVSAIAALGLTIIPDAWVGWLGLVPLALGLYGLVRAARKPPEKPEPAEERGHGGALSIAALTIANGADNLSVYTPLFRAASPMENAITISVFAVLVGLWCAGGSWLGSHPRVIAFVERYGRWIVPSVFVLIGCAIVLRSGVLTD